MFSDSSIDQVYVADVECSIVDAISCHVINFSHQAGTCGRNTSLVVDKTVQDIGIGKSLVKRAECYFNDRGWGSPTIRKNRTKII